MKFSFIDVERAVFRISDLCRALSVSRQGYYAWKTRPECARASDDRRLAVLISEAHFSHKKAGSIPVCEELKSQGVCVSRKRVMRLMQEHGLRGHSKVRFTTTTDSNHAQPVAGNILDRNFTASAPNQRWVGDVTYLYTPSGTLFLAAILDLFSRAIVGWAVSAVNDRKLALAALDMALKRRCPEAGLIHHTDQGSPYASADYQRVLETQGIVCSMSRRGNCYDNAVMESWFGKLKVTVGERFESHADAKRELFEYIEVFYNRRRRHSSLGYVSPAAFEAAWATKTAAQSFPQ